MNYSPKNNLRNNNETDNNDYFLHDTSSNSLCSLENDIEKQFLKDKITSLEIEIKELKAKLDYYYNMPLPIGIILDITSRYYINFETLDEIINVYPKIDKHRIKDIIIANKPFMK